MKERKEAEEARKIAERFQQEALIAREHRALELDRDLRFSKLKIINAVNDFNKTLVSIFVLLTTHHVSQKCTWVSIEIGLKYLGI